ncbi:MFS transporter [Granulicoccus phenolivorans]|uniref:MFS transporter n=1 Tax=Granulicoccus phenolivorans TaxID=266854 RepID=UPI00042224ED|nr:MFS transporter [Granulicoccus phenolivorans]
MTTMVQPTGLSVRRRWALLATVGTGLLLITLDNSILYTALPTLTTELDASAAESLWIINAYPLVMAGLLLGSGTLGDRIGHARMFLAGLAIFGLASLLAAFAPNPEVLIAARAVLAIGAAAMMPATLALIRTHFTVERERNFAIAVWGSIAVIGAAVGPILGGLLLEFFWWGSVFLVNVPVVVVAFVVTVVIAPKDVPDRSKRWDAISSAQIMVGLVGTTVAIKQFGHLPPSPWILGGALLAAVAGFTLFARRQRRLADPLLELSVFRNPAFTAGVLAAVISMFAIAGIELSTTQRYQLVAGFTPIQAGLLVAMVAIGSLPTALLGGAFLHRVGLRTLIAGGFGLSVLGIVITVAGFGSNFAVLVGGLLITGAGLGAVMSVASTAILGNVPVRRAGMASGVEEVSYEFGSLSAVAILGSLLTLVYSATVVLPPGAPAAAGESLSAAVHATADPATLAAAATAFDGAYLIVLGVIGAVLAIGTVTTGILLRHYGPGTRSQLYSDH